MSLFFEHSRGEFVCPICSRIEKVDKKCFVMIRQRNDRIRDNRKNLICKSSSMCSNCYSKIEKFIKSLKDVRK